MRRRALVPLLALWAALPAAQGAEGPVLALIIDDLGHNLREGERAVGLPAPVACAVLPHTPNGERLARAAHERGKEVLLHLPMESREAERLTGPGALEQGMPERELVATLEYDLSTVPFASGVNNHMGSRLTAEPEPMGQLMRALRQRGDLFFVDSLTHPQSVAGTIARQHRIPVAVRDVFLDHTQERGAIEHQLDHALRIAHERGWALAIGHPYPETMDVLERRLAPGQLRGVTVVPVRAILDRSKGRSAAAEERAPWSNAY